MIETPPRLPATDVACLAIAADGGNDEAGVGGQTRCEDRGIDYYDFDAEDWSGSMESGMSESAALELLRSGTDVREAGARAAGVVDGNVAEGGEEKKKQMEGEGMDRAARRGTQADHRPDLKAQDTASEAASPPPPHIVSSACTQRGEDGGGFAEVVGEETERGHGGGGESEGGDDSTEAPYYQKLMARRRPHDGQVPILQYSVAFMGALCARFQG